MLMLYVTGYNESSTLLPVTFVGFVFLQEMKKIQETRLAALANSSSASQSGSRRSSIALAVNQGSSNSYSNVLATAIVAVCFAFFAYSVRYVLKTISYDEL